MSLDVGGNNIEAKGITALANALKGNENLKSLELGYNPIHEKGAQALADVVKYDLKVIFMQRKKHCSAHETVRPLGLAGLPLNRAYRQSL